MGKYWKSIIAAVVTVLIVVVKAVQVSVGDGSFSLADGLVVALSALGAIGVYLKANTGS